MLKTALPTNSPLAGATALRRLARLAGLAMASAVVTMPGAAPAAVVQADPDTLVNVVAAARPGDVIRLRAGQYQTFNLKERNWQPAITIEAGDALVEGVHVSTVTGFHWRGGVFNGGLVRRNAFSADRNSNDIRMEGGRFSDYVRNGIVVSRSSGVDLINNRFTNMQSDGIQIAESRQMLIEGNSCLDFRPTEKAHPDCIQIWSRPTSAPSADIVIRNNVMKGAMQGIGLFNHARNGVDDGGFDRITVVGNDVEISDFYHGIALYGCRDCLVRDNRVKTLAGANPKVRAWIRFDEASSVVACDNRVTSFPGWNGQGRCKAETPSSVSRR